MWPVYLRAPAKAALSAGAPSTPQRLRRAMLAQLRVEAPSATFASAPYENPGRARARSLSWNEQHLHEASPAPPAIAPAVAALSSGAPGAYS